MVTSFTYTARNQIILPLLSSIWTEGDKYNITTDWRYVKFPSYTYGLGGYTALADGYLIDYSAVRLHTTLLRRIRQDMYAGIGYNLDYFYNVFVLPSFHINDGMQLFAVILASAAEKSM